MPTQSQLQFGVSAIVQLLAYVVGFYLFLSLSLIGYILK